MSDAAEFSEPIVDPRIGTLVHDKYRIVRKLGEGGMGAVYEGEHVLIRKRVALKFVHPQFASNGQVVARFYREATAATSIGNEHIIEVTDIGRTPDGSVFMVLEFLDGQSFGSLLEALGPAPLGRTARITMQICDALAAAHAKGIVHRDLKPDNVFLISRSGNPDFVKVLDFGIAKVMDASDGLGVNTRTHAALGTPYYMSPEQCRGAKDVDARSDLYALGIILHRALSGVYPFAAEAFPELVMQICTQAPTGLRFFRPELPEAVERVVLKLLEKNRSDRFPDAASVSAALAPFADYDTVGSMSNHPVGASAAGGPVSFVGPSGTPKSGVAFTTPPSLWTPPGVPAATGIPPSPRATLDAMGIGRSRSIGVIASLAVVLAFVGGGAAFLIGQSRRAHRPATLSPAPLTPTALSPLGRMDLRSSPHTSIAPVPSALPSQTPAPSDPHAAATMDPPSPADPFAVTPGARVRVQIMTAPSDAQLFLNGRHIANPFDAELPQSTVVHRLEARHGGYTTVVQDLVLEFPQTVRVRMQQGAGVQDLRHPTPSTGPHVANPSGHTETPVIANPNPGAANGETAMPPAARAPMAPLAPVPPPTESQGVHTGVPPPAQGVRSPF